MPKVNEEAAYQEGLKAFTDGKNYNENPHSSRCKKGRLWEDGYLEGVLNEYERSEEFQLLKKGMPQAPKDREELTFRLLSAGKGVLLHDLIQQEKPTKRGVYHFRFRTCGGIDTEVYTVRVYQRWGLLWVAHSILGKPISHRMDNSLFNGGVWEYIQTPSKVAA